MSQILPESQADVPELVQLLEKGDTVICPTETCYGLSCDATNDAAVAKVFAIKERQREKTVLIVMANIDMAMQYVEWNPTIQAVAERYWPGPVTIVAKKRDDVSLPKGVVAADGTIAFRVSSYDLVVQLAATLGKPIVSTSANIASHASPYDIDTIRKDFAGKKHQPDLIIDAGDLPDQMPSTIVRVSDGGDIHILRQGGVVVSL